jgi:hypothetical protein
VERAVDLLSLSFFLSRKGLADISTTVIKKNLTIFVVVRILSLAWQEAEKNGNGKSEETAKTTNDGHGRMALLQLLSPAAGNCELEGLCSVGAAFALVVDPGRADERSGQAEGNFQWRPKFGGSSGNCF